MKKVIISSIFFFLINLLMFAQEEDTTYQRRAFQFTFLLPPLSTNGVDNINIVNDVSLNLFIGASGGVEAFEFGGFINIDRFYVKGFQVAGFGNTNGGYLGGGGQVAGFYNIAGQYATGAQVAGFVNVTGFELAGTQLAGFVNVTGRSVDGFQGAGFMSIGGTDLKGAQVSGFMNITGKKLDGFQGAGFMNIAGDASNAVQTAGFGNVAGGGNSYLQAAGFFNVANRIKGAQLAGFMNVAGLVNGVQAAGFLNICDSINGVPIGFISYVKRNGYRQFEVTASEIQYANIAFRMGVKQLYNIYSFGKPFGPASRWMFGGGLGTVLDLNPRMILNIEATIHQELWIANENTKYFLYTDRLNLYNSAKFLFGWRIEDAIDFYIGPTFNVSVAHTSSDEGIMSWWEIPSYSFYNYTKKNQNLTNVQIWIGVQGGVRF
jgi:hypothetical protein